MIFSRKLIETLQLAINHCAGKNERIIKPAHLLSALSQIAGSLAYDILFQAKIPSAKLTAKITKSRQPRPVFDNQSLKVIERAAIIAFQHRHSYVGTEHLLAALIELPNEQLHLKLPADRISKHLQTVMKSSSHIPNFSRIFQTNQRLDEPMAQRNANILSHFCVDLTREENFKQTNPIIGRESEIERLTQILCRKDKNNPVILGDAGVGKTALVEGLAKKISQRQVPPALINKKILNLDLGLVVAGTIYRGEFESRVKAILDEVSRDKNIILFVDELHNIIGAGSASGSMDAANMLKPMLARGQLRCIGATTPDEFKKHIESDPALERRFQPVYLNEPDKDEALRILNGVKENYQNFHGVLFDDNAISAAVELSSRYIQDKLLPDKAIDLIDEAAARVKIKQQSNNPEIKEELALEDELLAVRKEKNDSVAREDFQRAIKLKEQEIKIIEAIKLSRQNRAKQADFGRVTQEEIYQVVSQKTGIPLPELNSSEYQRMNNAEEKLKTTVIGQDEQIEKIMKSIAHAELGFSDEERPRASFMFLGESGCGKTFLARELAKLLFKKQEAFIQLDMSEFNEKFQASKLIGAPAGYVGYRESNKFTDLVKKNPYCLILLDEIDKAHPDILDLFLQILEHGAITDASGRKVNFKNSIIIMTTNIMSDKLFNKTIGFNINNGRPETKDERRIIDELKKQFKPELINRINHIIIFNKLEQHHFSAIARKTLEQLRARCAAKGVAIEFDESVFGAIAEEAHKMASAARGVHALIKEMVEQPLTEKIIAGINGKYFLRGEKETGKNNIIIETNGGQ